MAFNRLMNEALRSANPIEARAPRRLIPLSLLGTITPG